MAIGKWIGGILGFMSAGPLGALAGIVLGGLLDQALDAVNTPDTQGSGDGFATAQVQGQRNSFLFSMLVLASYVIKADGRVMHSEMETVRRTLRQSFGDSAALQGDEILRRLFDEQKRVGAAGFRQTVADCCRQISGQMDRSQLLQLLNFLVVIAQADGRVDTTEVTATDDELKRAYRRLALEHHPDKVAALGEDIRRAAEKKLQEINAAEDSIWKARGL